MGIQSREFGSDAFKSLTVLKFPTPNKLILSGEAAHILVLEVLISQSEASTNCL